jgi:hypothetical protein
VQMIGDSQAHIRYSVAGRSGGRVMPCVVVLCTNRQGVQVSWFSLKTKVDSSPDLASKPVATILVVWPQNHSLGFPGFGLKISSLVSWFGSQNQVGYGLLVAS